MSVIGIDARPLAFPGTGNARYLQGMLAELVQLRPDFDWVLFSHRPVHPEYLPLLQAPNVSLDARTSGPGRFGPVWVHTQLPALVRASRCDLFWSSLSMLPLFAARRMRIPRIVNFHDLNVFVAPDTMKAWVRVQQRLLTGHVVANADRILCLSETTKRDLLQYYPGYPAERAIVIYPGCELPTVAAEEPRSHELAPGFFLSVGSIEPRKNLGTLVAAYLAARRAAAEPERFPRLVILGRRGWGDDSLYQVLASGKNAPEGVTFLENQSDGVLRWCYENAGLLVFPTLHEGFGLPVIEALQLGRAVLVSDIPILREVAPGARFVPPLDEVAWSAALTRAAGELRADGVPVPAIDRGFWSWEQRARALLQVIEGLLG